MSLRSKIALILALVVFGYAVCDHALQRAIVLPRFAELERRTAETDVLRVRRALEAEVETLDSRCSEWATWSEACAFLEHSRASDTDSRAHCASFERAHLGLEGFRQSNINLLYVVDADGSVRWGRIRDLESGDELRWRELAFDRLQPNHPLLVRVSADGNARAEPIRGLALSELGPMFISSRPIGCAPGAPPQGTLILGRILSPALVATLRKRTEVEFDVSAIDGSLSDEQRARLDRVTSSTKPVIEFLDGERALGSTSFDDLRARPALLVSAKLRRDVSSGGHDAARYSLLSTLAAGMLLLVVLLAILRRAVVDPLVRLTQHVVEIGRTDDYSRKTALERSDELGLLSREFDSMMGKLESSRAQLVDAARAAGMSEIATGILHNVGNVLNSVNVSADLATQRLRATKLVKLEKLNELVQAQGEKLGEFIAAHPKGKHVSPFLAEVTRDLRAEHDDVESELRSLNEGIEHIKRLVDAQQELAGHSEVREPIELGAQIELAWGIVTRSNSNSSVPQLERDIEDLGRVRADRHKLVQILVNLFKNACEAIQSAGRGDGVVRVRVRGTPAGAVRIEVHDNGCGIAPENLSRMFQHGFTTKPDGHGFGLHSCANSATEMDGTISVHSDGAGRGATFVLEFETAMRAAA